ncbi:uncharacterized protein OsI_027940-like [Olea europaea var. sylvestris]|uniref:uncharacterized protein OsI_027940-like n=1 Tax=Olea europaea var. sylvestris TaxID=158386 RepID=UPI000C1D8972|nr:uncharacterized protein OsI_027940-like [Olea europaea var. sylvestris]
MSRHPLIKWAQRSDKLFITVELPDAKNVKLNLEPEGKFFFSATSGANNVPYEIDIDLYDKVDVNESKASFMSRNICYLVKKAESKWWSRLLKQEGKPPVFIKVDWDKWIDEDEQDEKREQYITVLMRSLVICCNQRSFLYHFPILLPPCLTHHRHPYQ